uniref:Uncharacterized protein n=2 Tax=Methanomicrobia TaxID=224756 RepID=A0A7G9YZQ1_9EURY|nr:hypothetical protein LAAKCKNM_00029 [Methanosarcinales archaeon ANME-2c ERB4]QNO52463.1 hypothetical protein BDIGKBFL_00020 [Methanosarcinales archaeon ANME-1 ERB6]QNO53485.1 hypothetical protein OBNMHAHF_00010 [Methanosarcinales archaeon ANME-1 ERB6]
MGKEIAAFDYEKERKRFNWDIPEGYNFVEKGSESCLIMGLRDSLFNAGWIGWNFRGISGNTAH